MQQRDRPEPTRYEVSADGRSFGYERGLAGAYGLARAAHAQVPAATVIATRIEAGCEPLEVLRFETVKGKRKAWVL